MATFTTPNGNQVSSDDPATINDWRHRTGWTEVEEGKKRTTKKAAKQPEPTADENA